MSADLFAAFESPQPQPSSSVQSKPPSQGSTQATSSASQPFSFLGSGTSQAPISRSQPWTQPQQAKVDDPWEEFADTSSSNAATSKAFDDDEDGWGDFETAAATATSVSNPVPPALPKPSIPPWPTLENKPLQRTRIMRAPTIELMTNSLIDLPGANALPEEIRSPSWVRQSFSQQQTSIPKTTSALSKPVSKPVNTDPNVLFDADDFDGQPADDDDDEFGEFEAVSQTTKAPVDLMSGDFFTPPATARRSPPESLSALNLTNDPSSYPQAPKSPAFQERNPYPGLALRTPTKAGSAQNDDPKTSPVTAWPTFENNSAGSNKLDKGWGVFDDLPSDTKVTNQAKTVQKTKTTSDNWDWDAFDEDSKGAAKSQPLASGPAEADTSWAWDSVDNTADAPAELKEDSAPPINVPPPSVLMSIFPQLLSEINDSLYKPVSGQAFSTKNRILSDPRTIDFLRGYLHLAIVAARVIAGRKLRWHRDRFLSQGMSISAAGSKGMKLAGVDKTQAVREDREANDILDLWKEHVGRLRSSVAAANSSIKDPSKHLKIPDLRENIQVQTAKGVVTAPKPCVICGLKRDERLSRIDVEVEDSFGEWWVDHWGHTTCKRFWLKHENALRQR